MSTQQLETQQAARPRVARIIHRLSVPIILGWLAVAVLITIGVPRWSRSKPSTRCR